ncbi:MAG: DoxX family membrane protein [Deltaproteobacteria bacterium]|nr:DoxX family membrane protein [Deltaproteobacteria bacterium]
MSSRFPRSIVDNKFFPFVCRIVLGGIFVYASVGKILYPADFAEAVANYQLLPVKLTNLAAITLPWLEFIAGLLLLNGFKTQSSNLFSFFLLCVFSLGAISALARGLDINCGCFTEESRKVGLSFLIEEAAMLLMTITIYFFDKGFLSIDNLLSRYYSPSSDPISLL